MAIPLAQKPSNRLIFPKMAARNKGEIGPGIRGFGRPAVTRSGDETSHFRRDKLATMSDVTRILNAIEQGDPHAAEQLLPLVYDELRKLAAQKMAAEKPGQTLQATALVHEAYLRLIGDAEQPWKSRGHFLCAAAEAMRRILIEQARRKGSVKHGGGRQRVDLDVVAPAQAQAQPDHNNLLALDEALTRLAQQEPARAELVKLRFFGGLTMPEAAAALGISLATAERYWVFARAWLCAELVDPELASES
jgi:RNA polymerase sigma factor (TIGR02999 family)